MKQTLLTLFIGLLATGLSFSQSCTPDQQFIGSPPGLYPAGPLGPTCELTAPKTIISLTDTLVSSPLGPVTLYISRMKLNAVTGLPSGLLLNTDVMASADGNAPWGYWDNTGTIPNQTSAFGCAYVYGTGGDWDAAVGGGPNNDGEYPLVFEVDAYAVTSQNAFVDNLIGLPTWVSSIDPGLGGGSFFILDTLVVASDYAEISTSITGDANVEPGQTYTYSVPMDPNVDYNWTVTNGAIQSGQGTNEIEVIWSGSGNVEVDLTDEGCSGVDDLDVMAIATGLDEVAGINASVYPNPSNGFFNLQLENTDLITARIIDVSGKVLRTQQLRGSTLHVLNMVNAPDGVFILELESENGKTFKRLIKQ